MDFLINFLLISGISFIIVDTAKVATVRRIIEDLFSDGLSPAPVPEIDNLKLIKGGFIGETYSTIVWKGIYKDAANVSSTVACKISLSGGNMMAEKRIYEALDATTDPKIEEHGIPRIYYYGKIFRDRYFVAAMTLFDGTLYDRYIAQNKTLSPSSILMIFKQAVEGLRYLNTKNCLHNVITPYSIFLSGEKVFLGDFYDASLNGRPNDRGNNWFASRKYHLGQQRTAKDDLESLLYTIWFIANVPISQSLQEGEPIGFILKDMPEKQAESEMRKKCKRFKDPNVCKAMKLICADVVSSKSPVPNYESIINALTRAINQLKGSSAGSSGA